MTTVLLGRGTWRMLSGTLIQQLQKNTDNLHNIIVVIQLYIKLYFHFLAHDKEPKRLFDAFFVIKTTA